MTEDFVIWALYCVSWGVCSFFLWPAAESNAIFIVYIEPSPDHTDFSRFLTPFLAGCTTAGLLKICSSTEIMMQVFLRLPLGTVSCHYCSNHFVLHLYS
jgi:hypothetical protein